MRCLRQEHEPDLARKPKCLPYHRLLGAFKLPRCQPRRRHPSTGDSLNPDKRNKRAEACNQVVR
jgi:hypothetical protein